MNTFESQTQTDDSDLEEFANFINQDINVPINRQDFMNYEEHNKDDCFICKKATALISNVSSKLGYSPCTILGR